MQADMMAHVYEIGFPRIDTCSKGQSLIHTLMRPMRLVSQSVHNETINLFQMDKFFFWERLHIRDIDQRAYAVAQDGQRSMHHTNRQDFDAVDMKRLVRMYLMQSQLRHTGILVFHKAIGHPASQTLTRVFLGIQLHLSQTAKRTQVINASHMVIVLMSYQDSVYLFKRKIHHLRPKIRTAIKQNARIIHLH